MPRKKTSSIAIVRADHIGDLVLTTPIIRALAVAGWNVDIIAPDFVSLLKENPHIRDTYRLSKIAPGWPQGWVRLARFLREKKYDAIILPFAHPRILLLASLLSGARHRIAMFAGIVGRITGHRCMRSGFASQARPYALTIARVLEPLGVHMDQLTPELFLSRDEVQTGRKLLDDHLDPGIRIGVHPIALGNTCNLPAETYRKLVLTILERTNWKIAVTGSSADRTHLGDWLALESAHPRRLWITCGKTPELRSLAAILGQLDALVVPSTGPLHIAFALGTPTISPFCPQIPVCAEIWGHPPLETSALTPQLPPCNPQKIHGKHCDFKGTITAEHLFARLDQILRQSDTPAPDPSP